MPESEAIPEEPLEEKAAEDGAPESPPAEKPRPQVRPPVQKQESADIPDFRGLLESQESVDGGAPPADGTSPPRAEPDSPVGQLDESIIDRGNRDSMASEAESLGGGPQMDFAARMMVSMEGVPEGTLEGAGERATSPRRSTEV